MSFREESKNALNLLRPTGKPMVKLCLLISGGDFLEILSEEHLERGALPEPFDVASHIGNFREGGIATVAASAMIGIFTCFGPMIDGSRDILKRNLRRTAIGAFVASSAIQAVGEKFELTNNVVQENTGDVLDAAYGIGWSGVIAVGVYRLASGLEQQYPAEGQALVLQQDDITQAPTNRDS